MGASRDIVVSGIGNIRERRFDQTRHLLDTISQGRTETIPALADAAVVADILDAERESVLSGESRRVG